MAYATKADIDQRITQAELIRITDENDTGAVDTDKVDAAIEAADLEIDSYLGERYALPLATAPALLTTISVDLALWNLYSIVDADGLPKTRGERRANAIKMLERLRDGEIALAGESMRTNASFSADERLFTRDRLRGLL